MFFSILPSITINTTYLRDSNNTSKNNTKFFDISFFICDGIYKLIMTEDHALHNSCKPRLSKMINTIIKECQVFEDPHPLSLSKKLHDNHSKISILHEELNTQTFNPNSANNVINSVDRSAKLDQYISKKLAEIGTNPDFKSILKCSPTQVSRMRNSPSNFTFENVQESDISQILLKNKRGFGKGWKENSTKSPQNRVLLRSHLEPLPNSMFSPRNSSVQNRSQQESDPPTHSTQISVEILSIPHGIKDLGVITVPSNHRVGKSLASPTNQIKENSNNTEATGNERHRPLRSLQPPINGKYISISPSQEYIPTKFSQLSPIHIHRTMDKSCADSNSRLNPLEASGKKDGKLGDFINKLLEKNLGIRVKAAPQESPMKKKQESKLAIVIEPQPEDKPNESQYLNPEYRKYNEDLINKLKVQRIVVAEHKKNRRLTLWNFPPVKKTKQLIDN